MDAIPAANAIWMRWQCVCYAVAIGRRIGSAIPSCFCAGLASPHLSFTDLDGVRPVFLEAQVEQSGADLRELRPDRHPQLREALGVVPHRSGQPGGIGRQRSGGPLVAQ
jgi:hypothetical protein